MASVYPLFPIPVLNDKPPPVLTLFHTAVSLFANLIPPSCIPPSCLKTISGWSPSSLLSVSASIVRIASPLVPELIVTSPVNVPPANGIFVANESVIVVEKFASSPRAAASSLRVLSVPGAESTRSASSDCTYAVVAICVVFVLAAAVGANGVPVKVGDANGALAFNAVCKPSTFDIT